MLRTLRQNLLLVVAAMVFAIVFALFGGNVFGFIIGGVAAACVCFYDNIKRRKNLRKASKQEFLTCPNCLITVERGQGVCPSCGIRFIV